MYSSISLFLSSLAPFFLSQVFATGFEWDIEPSRVLRYHNCYDGLRCARLRLPLDWKNESDYRSVSIAVISMPAKVSEDDPRFGGTIITNPGGPGGSGVNSVVQGGQYLRSIVDSEAHYDIVSFDPRGVGRSTPSADCYKDDFARSAAVFQQRGMGDIGAGHDALKRQFLRAKAFGTLCAQPNLANNVRGFMSTASVARDMLALVDLIEETRPTRKRISMMEPSQKPLQQQRSEEARIQYLGFSYGTVLGNTFASMYPGRVGRMVLDGVEDANDYIEGAWAKNLVDAEDVIQYFYKTCFDAKENCALYKASDRHWKSIQKRVGATIQELDENPEPIIVPGTTQISSITGDDIRTAFQMPVNEPVNRFPAWASVLADVLRGNFSSLVEQLDIPSTSDACPPKNRDLAFHYNWPMDAAWSVLCSDGHDLSQHNVSYFESYVNEMQKQSAVLGSLWAQIRFECAGWQIRPNWRFKGPFLTPKPHAELKSGHPAAPLLFVSSKLDPATPLRNAVAMSSKHPGSSVLIQDSAGHCATYSSPSQCTRNVIQEYLKTGVVPPNGTVCPGDCVPFEPCEAITGSRALGIRHWT